MSKEGWLLREKYGEGVISLTMNCAPVNALTSENLMYLVKLIEELEDDTSVNSIIINSSFKVFSAGINLKDAQIFSSDSNMRW